MAKKAQSPDTKFAAAPFARIDIATLLAVRLWG